jgi:hypothetical protein
MPGSRPQMPQSFVEKPGMAGVTTSCDYYVFRFWTNNFNTIYLSDRQSHASMRNAMHGWLQMEISKPSTFIRQSATNPTQ